MKSKILFGRYRINTKRRLSEKKSLEKDHNGNRNCLQIVGKSWSKKIKDRV